MNSLNRRHFLPVLPILLFLFAPSVIYGQKFLYDVDFRFGLDNREYARMCYSPSKTIFGAILAPKVGIGWGNGHSVYVGGDLKRYFGKTAPKYDVSLLAYYQYDGPSLDITAGAFPRKRLAGEYPSAFLDDAVFFDTVMEGAAASYTGKTWKAEAALDWLGMVQGGTRERFAAYAYFRKDFSFFYGAVSFMMHHYAGSEKVSGVVDNLWLYPYIGFDFSGITPLSVLDIRAGWIQTFQNDRVNETGFVNPGGFQGEFVIEKWGVGLSETIYLGKSLQPFFNSTDRAGEVYGTSLYLGNTFYGTDSGIYNRLELYYSPSIPKVSRWLSFKLSFAAHYDGYGWGWQQLACLVVNLNQNLFRKGK